MRTLLLILVLGITAGGIGGCAHYSLPSSHLETPEASGPRRVGRVELAAAQSGTDLQAAPGMTHPSPDSGQSPEPVLKDSFPSYAFGFVGGISDRLDLGVRMQPGAPLMARAKYQLSGLPESESEPGNFSTALLGSAGFLLGSSGTSSVSFFAGDFSALAGYRAWKRHLFSAGAFFGFGSISGAQVATGANTYSDGGSVSQYGAYIGHQYTIESLVLRSELSYMLGGSLGASKIQGIRFGLLLGFNI